MRIRKLAKDLETDEFALMELLRSLGHARYTDPEQQLPGAVEAQIRRHARSLPKLAPPVVLPTPRPRVEEGVEPDLALFEKAMSSVKRIGAQPKPAARPPAARLPVPVAPPAPPIEVPRGRVPEITAPKPAPVKVTLAAPPPAAARARPAAAAAPVGPDAALRARSADQAVRIADLEARVAAQEARISALTEAAEAAEARATTLAAALADAEQAPPAAGEPTVATLRACFEQRGLLGEDEASSALRAILEARRVAELLRLQLVDPSALESFLWERVLLLSEDEPPPPGIVAVRVPAERSEGRQSSANRAAMSRFSTACLLHNIKCIVIVGGSPAYHRTIREGLDPRLDLRLVPGNRRGRIPNVPSADLVILWASTILDHSVSAQFPDGVVVPHRSVARMLGAATEWIEQR